MAPLPVGGLATSPRIEADEEKSRRGSEYLQEMLKMRVECAGINRQEAEDERSSRGGSSEPLGPEFCAVGREAWSEA